MLRQLSSRAVPHATAVGGSSSTSSSGIGDDGSLSKEGGSSSGRSGSLHSSSGRRSGGSTSSSGGCSNNSPNKRSTLPSCQLTARIKAAASSQQSLDLVVRAGQQCDSFNFCAAASRIAALHRQQPGAGAAHRQAFSALLQFVAEQRLVLNSVAVGQAVYVASALQYRFTARQQVAWGRQLTAALADAGGQTVANALWGWSKLRLRVTHHLAAAADASVQRTAPTMTPQQVSNTLWAHANGGWQLSEAAAAAALMQRLQVQLPSAEPQHVANSLWALATLTRPHGSQLATRLPALLSAIVAWADAGWHRLPAVWVCDLCYNLARLGAQPAQVWIDAAVTRRAAATCRRLDGAQVLAYCADMYC